MAKKNSLMESNVTLIMMPGPVWSRIHFPHACQGCSHFFFILQYFFAVGIIIQRKHEAIKWYCKHTNSCDKEFTNTASTVFKQASANSEFLKPKHTELVQQINRPAEWAACVFGIKSGVKVFYEGF